MGKKTEIVLVSDNHGQRKQIEYLRKTYPSDYFFLHCGDSEMYPEELEGFAVVRGNNDGYNLYPANRILKFGKHRIYLCHGHLDMFAGFWDMLAKRAKAEDCDIVCFGHIHRYLDIEVDGIRILNPGSMWYNRDGSCPSYMRITIDDDEITAQRMDWNPKKMK